MAGPTRTIATGLAGVWAAATILCLGFVLRYGHDAPWADEWEFVPALVGEEPGIPWLWHQHNEHRLPLPRLLYLGLYHLTLDFRTGMVVQVAVMSALAAGLMWLSSSLRGRPAWADAFFPLALFHPGHAENWLMGYQLCFALSAAFACGIAMIAARTPPASVLRCGAVANVCLLGLLFCGAMGFPFLPAVGGWLVILAAKTRSWTMWGVLLTGPLIGAGYVAVYLMGYGRPPGHPVPSLSNAGQAAVVAAQFLATAWGVGTAWVWPLAAAATVAVGGVVVRRAVRQPADPGVLGLASVVIGTVGLAVLIGIGRSGFASDEMGLAARYAWLSFPILAAGYLTAVRFGGRLGQWLPLFCCLGSLAAFPFNTVAGMARGSGHDHWLSAIAGSARAGATPDEIVRTHLKNSGQEGRAIRGIPLLQRAGVSELADVPRSRFGLLLSVLVGVGLITAWLIRRTRFRRSDPISRFRSRTEGLAGEYFRHAATAGTARGLRWVRCGFVGDPLFVTDRRTRTTTALISLAVDVEPEEGGGLEDVPAARIPRTVTATFAFGEGDWKPVGKPLFNLTPADVVARSRGRYVPLDPPPPPPGR